MTHAHPDEAGFLGRILANPADDLPRLVYADWLEEQAGTVPCNWCGGTGEDRPPPLVQAPDGSGVYRYVGPLGPCPAKCDHGQVSTGSRERAEFIRVQVELAAMGESAHLRRGWTLDQLPAIDNARALRKRERALVTAHGYGWAGPVAEFIGPPKDWPDRFRRGFVHHVAAPLAVLFGGPCLRCRNGLLPSVDGDFNYCEYCSGTGTTPGVAADLFRCQPVERVTPVGIRPWRIRRSPEGWTFGRDNGPGQEYLTEPDQRLPGWLYDVYEELSGGKSQETSLDALDALSAACVALGRERAGLTATPAPVHPRDLNRV